MVRTRCGDVPGRGTPALATTVPTQAVLARGPPDAAEDRLRDSLRTERVLLAHAVAEPCRDVADDCLVCAGGAGAAVIPSPFLAGRCSSSGDAEAAVAAAPRTPSRSRRFVCNPQLARDRTRRLYSRSQSPPGPSAAVCRRRGARRSPRPLTAFGLQTGTRSVSVPPASRASSRSLAASGDGRRNPWRSCVMYPAL
jgi:hypothetical protein